MALSTDLAQRQTSHLARPVGRCFSFWLSASRCQPLLRWTPPVNVKFSPPQRLFNISGGSLFARVLGGTQFTFAAFAAFFIRCCKPTDMVGERGRTGESFARKVSYNMHVKVFLCHAC